MIISRRIPKKPDKQEKGNIRRIPAGKPVSRKYDAMAIVAILLLVSIFQIAYDGEEGSEGVSSADYGIFQSITTLNEEKSTRGNDPAVLNDVSSIKGAVIEEDHSFDGLDVSGFRKEKMTLPEPLTSSPVVFEALNSNPVINNTEVIDWILPRPIGDEGLMNYLVLAHHNGENTWALGSMIPRIGLFTDSSLDKWLYLDIDSDPSTGDASGFDVRARLTFARNILERDWVVNLFPPQINFRNAGARMEIEPLGDLSGITSPDSSIYFIKSISYDGNNYIWSVGFSLRGLESGLEVKIQAKEWRASPNLSGILQGGLLNLTDLDILEVIGPYTVSYHSEGRMDQLDVYISVIRVFGMELFDRAYINLLVENDRNHEYIPNDGRIELEVKNTDSPIKGVNWIAGDPDDMDKNDTTSLTLKYVEFSDALIQGELIIDVLPHYLDMDLDSESIGQHNVTRVSISTPEGIGKMFFREVIYPEWNGTDNSLSVWNATSVEIVGIPPDLEIETTTTPPFEPDETETGLGTSGLDLLMKQISSRFYRIGTILRELPDSVLELPSTGGWTDIDCMGDSIYSVTATLTDSYYLNGTGDYLSFLETEHGSVPISIRIGGLKRYHASFLDANIIQLDLLNPTTLKIYSYGLDRESILVLDDMREKMELTTSDRIITYSASGEEGDKRPSIFYGYRDKELFFDASFRDLPDLFSLARGESVIDISTGGNPIGLVEVFCTNSTEMDPLDLPGMNFLSTRNNDGEAAISMRLTGLESLIYDNSSEGFIEIETENRKDFYVVVKDNNLDMEMLAAFVPLPSKFHVDLPDILGRPNISLPDLSSIKRVTAYGEMLLSVSELGRTFLSIAPEVSRGISESIGKYSTGFSISWEMESEDNNLDLLLDIRKGGVSALPDPKWTHGIWLEQEGMGKSSTINGRIFLPGMPSEGSLNLTFSTYTISALIDFKSYSPTYSWMLIHTSGVQDRDIELYLTGLKKEMDLRLDINITTDLSIGGLMVVDISARIVDEEGSQIALGPTIATLTKATPILSVRSMYLPVVPSVFDLEARISEGMEAHYRASQSIEFLYFKITKFMNGRWSQVYAIFHDLPLWFDIILQPNREFSIQEPFPLQGLPLIDISTSSGNLDLFVEYDGSGFGQRGRFQIYARNMGNTTSSYLGNDYVMESDGIGFISLDVGRLPVLDQFTLSSLILLGTDVKLVRIGLEMVFGSYPVIRIKEAEGEGIQLKMSSQINLEGKTHDASIFYINLKKKSLMGLPIYYGVSVTKDTAALDMKANDGGIILPAPILSLWYWALGGS